VVIIAVVITSSFVVYQRMQKKRMQSVEVLSADRHSDEALAESMKKASVLLAHGKRAEAQTTLTDAALAYVRRKYGLDSRNMNAEDVYKVTGDVGAPKTLLDTTIHLIEWSEGLKFSGMPRSEAELKEVIRALEQIVELSPP
jgi:hypothetical protein